MTSDHRSFLLGIDNGERYRTPPVLNAAMSLSMSRHPHNGTSAFILPLAKVRTSKQHFSGNFAGSSSWREVTLARCPVVNVCGGLFITANGNPPGTRISPQRRIWGYTLMKTPRTRGCQSIVMKYHTTSTTSVCFPASGGGVFAFRIRRLFYHQAYLRCIYLVGSAVRYNGKEFRHF